MIIGTQELVSFNFDYSMETGLSGRQQSIILKRSCQYETFNETLWLPAAAGAAAPLKSIMIRECMDL